MLLKFYVEPSWGGEYKIAKIVAFHWQKMSALSIYGKNL